MSGWTLGMRKYSRNIWISSFNSHADIPHSFFLNYNVIVGYICTTECNSLHFLHLFEKEDIAICYLSKKETVDWLANSSVNRATHPILHFSAQQTVLSVAPQRYNSNNGFHVIAAHFNVYLLKNYLDEPTCIVVDCEQSNFQENSNFFHSCESVKLIMTCGAIRLNFTFKSYTICLFKNA